jgi:hypothetical protein
VCAPPNGSGATTGRCLRLARPSVRGVETVEHRGYRLEQRIIIFLNRPGAGHDAGKSGPFRSRDSANIQMVHQRTEAGEARIVVQSEAGQKHFERDLGINMGEFRAVKIESDRPLGTVERALQPHESRIRINEALNEPGGPASGAEIDWSRVDQAIAKAMETCGDSDDLFVDSKRHRVYVVCGEGSIDVFAYEAAGYRALGRVATSAGTRTALFVPELDRLYLAVRATITKPASIWSTVLPRDRWTNRMRKTAMPFWVLALAVAGQ